VITRSIQLRLPSTLLPIKFKDADASAPKLVVQPTSIHIKCRIVSINDP